MPILIILLFYIHDLVKIKRYYSQTEFVGQQMANILQNLARTREIKIADIKHAASLAYLTIYPGTTMYNKTGSSRCHEFFHMPRVYIYYVRGEAEGKASCVWGCWINTASSNTGQWNSGTFASNATPSTVRWKTNGTPSSIYPTLKTEEGKPKIILEIQLGWAPDYTNLEGKTVSTAREAFGCRLVNPKNWNNSYFPSVVIFTPNDGFSGTRPT